MYIRHLINTRNGRVIVDFKNVICETCPKCKKDIPRIFFGQEPTNRYIREAIYKYTTADIVEEHSSINKSLLPKECKKSGCTNYRYN
jgi:hypothetical protein